MLALQDRQIFVSIYLVHVIRTSFFARPLELIFTPRDLSAHVALPSTLTDRDTSHKTP